MIVNKQVYLYNNDDGAGYFVGDEFSARRYCAAFPIFFEPKEGLSLFGYLAVDSFNVVFKLTEEETQEHLLSIPVYAKARNHECQHGWGMGYGMCLKCEAEGAYYIVK